MRARADQLAFEFPARRGWGGRRDGAGRKPTAGRRPVPHRTRPRHRGWQPLHLTLRAAAGVPSLRTPRAFAVIREAIATAQGAAFRVLHFSVQVNHLHAIVEADDARGLSRGIRALTIRIARRLNRALGRSGPVWGDRCHYRALSTPREVRNAIVYVLMNFRKHGADAGVPVAACDPFSSSRWFDGFAGDTADESWHDDPPISAPRTWLARKGWRKHGLVSIDATPSN